MEQTSSQPAKKSVIRLVYLYLVGLIGLVVFLIGGIGLVNMGFQALLHVDTNSYYNSPKDVCTGRLGSPYYGSVKSVPAPATPATPDVKPVDVNSQEFKDCVKEEDDRAAKQASNDRRREIALALAQLILGAPIWLYLWRVIQRDHRESNS